MPENKDLKRRIRARMAKTGESYTAARAHVLAAKKTKPEAIEQGASARAASVSGAARAQADAAEFAERAGTSDATVRERTGRGWAEWVALLDAAGAAAMPHGEIAKLVHEEHGVSGWWSQSVTVGYERIRGLREKGQRRGGGYDVSKSKTVPVAVEKLYAAFAPRTRRGWLGDVALRVKKATPHKTMRIAWDDGTSVDVYFLAKGTGKSTVSVQHGKLPSRVEADRMRAFWTEKLEALAKLLAVRQSRTRK